MSESQDLLQHPRRNLGNRYRSTAQKFANLAKADPERASENMGWAEQNARQAILHDFTDERNWRFLAELKVMNGDGDGLHAVLEDVFIILGRDPENLEQLKGIDYLSVGRELLEAAFARDALDPDAWWEHISQSEENAAIEDFAARCRRLDFRDQRANIVFGRRLERLRTAGHEEVFIELARHLLAHRPINHELWLEMGRLHERRSEIDDAWSCYDQVQQLRPAPQRAGPLPRPPQGQHGRRGEQTVVGTFNRPSRGFFGGHEILDRPHIHAREDSSVLCPC